MKSHNRLPKIGECCTPDDIIQVCKYFGWRDLAARIEREKAHLDDFVSDGCSMWPDEWKGKDFHKCCVIHDMEYWVGGSEEERFIADCRLAICVCRIAGVEMARVMLTGVEIGGGSHWHKSYSWGFGHVAKG